MTKPAILGLLCTSLARFGGCFSPSTNPRSSFSSSLSAAKIRDWSPGEGSKILELLQSAEDGSFNPEGSLDLDCRTEALLKESYDPEDGGCFVVAELDSTIIAVAGLIVGTPVEYQASGASVSSAQTTAAIRRCCCRLPSGSASTSSQVLTQLLITLEDLAIEAKATQVIALAYSSTGTTSTVKPSPQLLQDLGYEFLPQQLPGVDNAVQFGKSLQANNQQKDAITNNSDNSSLGSDMAGSALAIGALGFLLGGFLSVAQFIGLDTTTSTFSPPSDNSINRGLGRSLSSEDLGQLLQDEKLQRTTLDGEESTSSSGREWKDLSLEEQREEMALLQIINGQNVRIK